MATVSYILKSVGGITEQDASEPTGSDLTTRIQYTNNALDEWADAYKWDELRSFMLKAKLKPLVLGVMGQVAYEDVPLNAMAYCPLTPFLYEVMFLLVGIKY